MGESEFCLKSGNNLKIEYTRLGSHATRLLEPDAELGYNIVTGLLDSHDRTASYKFRYTRYSSCVFVCVFLCVLFVCVCVGVPSYDQSRRPRRQRLFGGKSNTDHIPSRKHPKKYIRDFYAQHQRDYVINLSNTQTHPSNFLSSIIIFFMDEVRCSAPHDRVTV